MRLERRSASGGAEAALAPGRRGQGGRPRKARALDLLDEELADAISRLGAELGFPVVDEDDPHLAPVVAVDDAGQGVDAVAHGEAAAGPDEADVAGRDLHVDPGRDGGAGARRKHDRLARAEVGTRGSIRGVLGQVSGPVHLHLDGHRRIIPSLNCYDASVEVKRNLFGLDRDGLEATMAELGEPAYRARQLYVWLYRRRVRDLAAMTDLGKKLRARLEAGFEVRWPEVSAR